MTEPAHLDWSAAEVRDGALSISVSGETDEAWQQTFARTLALLSSGGGGWGKVAFKKGKVTVEDVQEGSEENLRFALDGAVQEANAHHAADEDDESDEDAGEGDSDDEAGEADRRMTDRLRGPDGSDGADD